MKPSHRVYCNTCQQHLARYVLGRGWMHYGRAGAFERAAQHKLQHPGHDVWVIKVDRSSPAAEGVGDAARVVRGSAAAEEEPTK